MEYKTLKIGTNKKISRIVKVEPMDTSTPWKIMVSRSNGICSGLCYRLE